MTDLRSRLLAQLDKIQRVAREASGHYPGSRQVVGERWQWIRYYDDRPVDHETADEHFGDGRALLLTSLEEYPMPGLGPGETLPHVPIAHAVDVEARAGRHIVGNDPRTVMRQAAAFRRIVGRHRPDPPVPYSWGGQSCVECSCPASRDGSDCYQSVPYPCDTLLDVAYALFS